MKTNKYVEDLKTKSAAELAQELVAAKKELFNLRFQNATNQLDNTGRIKEVRKNIARIQTIITEKEKVAERQYSSASTSGATYVERTEGNLKYGYKDGRYGFWTPTGMFHEDKSRALSGQDSPEPFMEDGLFYDQF